jgi:hypothetical protein
MLNNQEVATMMMMATNREVENEVLGFVHGHGGGGWMASATAPPENAAIGSKATRRWGLLFTALSPITPPY